MNNEGLTIEKWLDTHLIPKNRYVSNSFSKIKRVAKKYFPECNKQYLNEQIHSYLTTEEPYASHCYCEYLDYEWQMLLRGYLILHTQ